MTNEEQTIAVTLGGIQRGALRSGWVGYWVDSRFHGRGVATAAVALFVAHGFGPVGLHRIEATIAPENLASRAVVAHLGFRQEGHLVRYLDINGAWRDHLLYALTVEEVAARAAATVATMAEGRAGPDRWLTARRLRCGRTLRSGGQPRVAGRAAKVLL